MRDSKSMGVGVCSQTWLKNGNAVKSPPLAWQSNQDSARKWANANAASIDQYNAWALQREPYSQRVKRWRDEGIRAA